MNIYEKIEASYNKANSPYEKIVVKWLGWLLVFLVLDRKHKIAFVNNDKEIQQTIQRLTKDLEYIDEKRSATDNLRTNRDSNRGTNFRIRKKFKKVSKEE